MGFLAFRLIPPDGPTGKKTGKQASYRHGQHQPGATRKGTHDLLSDGLTVEAAQERFLIDGESEHKGHCPTHVGQKQRVDHRRNMIRANIETAAEELKPAELSISADQLKDSGCLTDAHIIQHT
jgi:hypothetical protein